MLDASRRGSQNKLDHGASIANVEFYHRRHEDPGGANRLLNDLVDRLLSSQRRLGCSFFPAIEPFTSDLTGTASLGSRKVSACIANKVRRFKVASPVIRVCNTLVPAFVE